MPEKASITELFDKYTRGQLSPEETRDFLALFNDQPLHPELEQMLAESYPHQQQVWPSEFAQQFAASLTQKIVAKAQLNTGQPTYRIHFLRRWPWVAAAASLILITAAAYYYLSPTRQRTPSVATTQSAVNIPPGGEKAILTLANGQKIVLDNAANGQLANEGGAQIMKLANGQIAYETSTHATAAVWNTMSTPKGGQYQITLPDGTKAWLNAASSISFPTAFEDKERRIAIQGEVYLEVSPRKSQPFIVNINNTTSIEVLGTRFNIHAYSDEAQIRTSLVEGSVKVNRRQQSVKLSPGLQAVVDNDNIAVQPFDADQALAWKNGIFNFNGADLRTVMRQLERWYDIRVEYKATVSAELFKGEMYRNVNLADVLEMLERMDVQFKLEGKTLIVY